MHVVGKNRRGAKKRGKVTTKFKAAIAAAVCASSVFAAAQPKWQPIGTSTAGAGEYVDTTTAVRSGGVVIYWSKSEHRNDRGADAGHVHEAGRRLPKSRIGST